MKNNLIHISLFLIVAVLLVGVVSFAGSLTPPGSPSKTMKSLSDLYELINTGSNTPANNFTTPGAVSSTMNTIGDIYDLMTTKIADIDTTKILTGTSIFGKAGSAVAGADLSNMWNGTGQSIPGEAQLYGGVDDWNNGGSPASGRYTGTWTECTVGNSYCGTGDTGAAYEDDTTGLVWSKKMNSTTYALDNSGGSMTWYKANNCTETAGSVCTKNLSSKTGCEATTGWYTPHQKQFMQAYINGFNGTLEPTAYYQYWTATTLSDLTTRAFYMTVQGELSYQNKISTSAVRCVR